MFVFFSKMDIQFLNYPVSLTHNLTQNKKFPCGNSGMGSIKEHLISKRTASNRARRD